MALQTGTIVTVAFICLVLCSGAGAQAGCRPPSYRLGATYVDDRDDVVKSVSISSKDFVPSRLACLASELKERYRGRRRILVYIFSSRKASRSSIAPAEFNKENVEAFRQIHALYSF